MTRRVVLLHTVSGLLPVFKELSGQLPSDIQVSNIALVGPPQRLVTT